MMREAQILLVSLASLFALGLLMAFSTSAVARSGELGVPRQALYAVPAMLAFVLAMRFDYRRLADPPVYRAIVVVALVLLVLVLVPGIGVKILGARRWISLGVVSFQPSEFAKFALVVLLAVKLTANEQQLGRFLSGTLPPLLIAGCFAGMVYLQRDIGVPAVMLGTAVGMLFVAGARWSHLSAAGSVLLALVAAAVLFVPHRVQRLLAFRDPWAYREDESFQLIQAFSAFAEGGWYGRGLGAGEQKLGYLPAAETDFVFAVLGEELGLFGSLGVVLAFGVLTWAGLRVAQHAPDRFGQILGAGLTLLITVQAVFVLAVNTGLAPTKGLPLPFVSAGGTALIAYLGMAGVLINIALQSPAPWPVRDGLGRPRFARARG